MNLETLKKEQLSLLINRFPELEAISDSIGDAFEMLAECFQSGNRVFVAGNGGSASDANHIVGELMKSFRLKRPVDYNVTEKIKKTDANRAEHIINYLQCGLPIFSLTEQSSLLTAFSNDVSSDGIFAQQIFNYGHTGDVFWGISTSGNSRNIVDAAIVAKSKGMKVLALTGKGGGEISKFADIAIKAPENETYMIQEYHLPIYHCICLMLERYFYEK